MLRRCPSHSHPTAEVGNKIGSSDRKRQRRLVETLLVKGQLGRFVATIRKGLPQSKPSKRMSADRDSIGRQAGCFGRLERNTARTPEIGVCLAVDAALGPLTCATHARSQYGTSPRIKYCAGDSGSLLLRQLCPSRFGHGYR